MGHVVAVALAGAAAVSTAATAWAAAAEAALGRRKALVPPLVGVAAAAAAAQAEEAVVLRTKRPSPEIPKVLGVMLLRTTYDAVKEWGAYKSMATYQRSFWLQLRDGFQSFKARYETYDFAALYNATDLAITKSGGVTNRFYFAFLNDAQWRVIGKTIRRATDRTRFSRVVGDLLYRAILTGEELQADVPPEDAPPTEEEAGFNKIGTWPKLAEKLPSGTSPDDVRRGCTLLLAYLQQQQYCEGFEISDVIAEKDGRLRFTSFVKAPVNLEATVSLMRSNEDFVPRYDQRILQAYLADRGLESEFTDELADGLTGEKGPTMRGGSGIRTQWTLRPDPDAGL